MDGVTCIIRNAIIADCSPSKSLGKVLIITKFKQFVL